MVQRLYLGFEGTLFASERWATGLHFTAPESAPFSPDLVNWTKAVAVELGNHSSNYWLEEMGSTTALTAVTARYYGATGPAVFSHREPKSPASVGAGPSYMPAQCSRVVSLLTDISGRRYRGRMYLPACGADLQVSGKATIDANFTAQFADFLIDCAAAWPGAGDIRPAVYSPSSNVLTPVSRVRVGDVVDTQRRRRDGFVETYQEAQIP